MEERAGQDCIPGSSALPLSLRWVRRRDSWRSQVGECAHPGESLKGPSPVLTVGAEAAREQARAAAGLWGEAGGGAAQSQGIQEGRERSREGEFDFRHVGGT